MTLGYVIVEGEGCCFRKANVSEAEE